MNTMIAEVPNIPLLDSWLFWRNFLQKDIRDVKIEWNEDGRCKYCHGLQFIRVLPDGTTIRCVCALKKTETDLIEDLRNLRSVYAHGSLDDLEEWGSQESINQIASFKRIVRAWEGGPRKWMTIAGHPGTGKTVVLTWLADRFFPWALYVAEGELEELVYKALKEKDYESSIGLIKRIPVLLLDDLGSSHSSPFLVSSLRKIIDARYQMHNEKLTVVATNLDRQQLKEWDPRIADRILDQDHTILLNLSKIKSWRVRDAKTS
jgi:hypothetical protein